MADSQVRLGITAEHPLTIRPASGASLWFVTDADDDGSQRVIRLDLPTDVVYPCQGRDRAVALALVNHARALLMDPADLAGRS